MKQIARCLVILMVGALLQKSPVFAAEKTLAANQAKDAKNLAGNQSKTNKSKSGWKEGMTKGFEDDFSQARHPRRRAMRGDWKFENGAAFCVSDPELYKKYANHGPILRWPINVKDAEISFEFKPEKCKGIVWTLNNETGHVFRISLSAPKRSRIFGWTAASKTSDAQTILKKGVPTAQELDGKWVKFHLVIKGDQAKVKIGDFEADLKHASLARQKGETTICHALGQMATRNYVVKSVE